MSELIEQARGWNDLATSLSIAMDYAFIAVTLLLIAAAALLIRSYIRAWHRLKAELGQIETVGFWQILSNLPQARLSFWGAVVALLLAIAPPLAQGYVQSFVINKAADTAIAALETTDLGNAATRFTDSGAQAFEEWRGLVSDFRLEVRGAIRERVTSLLSRAGTVTLEQARAYLDASPDERRQLLGNWREKLGAAREVLNGLRQRRD